MAAYSYHPKKSALDLIDKGLAAFPKLFSSVEPTSSKLDQVSGIAKFVKTIGDPLKPSVGSATKSSKLLQASGRSKCSKEESWAFSQTSNSWEVSSLSALPSVSGRSVLLKKLGSCQVVSYKDNDQLPDMGCVKVQFPTLRTQDYPKGIESCWGRVVTGSPKFTANGLPVA